MKPAASDSDVTPPVEHESPRDWPRFWDRFWFQPAPPTIPAVMRILCGFLTLYVHLSYTTALLAYVGPEGWTDKRVTDWVRKEINWYAPSSTWEGQPQLLDKGYGAWSVWYHVQDPRWIWTLHIVFLLAMLSYTLGFCTRISGVITWIGTLSFCNRIPNLMFGMDAMMVIVQTYLLIAPTGLVYSVDAWLRRRRIGWWRDETIDLDNPPKTVAANLAVRFLQIHFCIVYAVSGLTKLQGWSWWSGDAVWGTIANPNFSPMGSALFKNFLYFLAEHRWLYHFVIGGGVLFTLLLEIGFPFVMFISLVLEIPFPRLAWDSATSKKLGLPQLRWALVTASVLLHTGIGFLMGLGGFSLFMFVFVLAFVPPEVAQAAIGQLKAKWQNAAGKFLRRTAAPPAPQPPAGKPKEELALQR
jgi:hypothetical protein